MTPNETQLQMLRHALGLDEHGRGIAYRNRYNMPFHGDKYHLCLAMVHDGLMEQHDGHWFTVTPDGMIAARAKPPELTPDEQVAALKEFARLSIRACCFGSGEDGDTLQKEAERLGIIEAFNVTQEHLDTRFVAPDEFEVGDEAFRFTAWVEGKAEVLVPRC